MDKKKFRFGAQVAGPASAKGWREKAQAIEAAGYSTIFLPDHFEDMLAPFAALMAAADAASKLRVGALVLDNDFRHPAVLAKEAATLDLLSGGRLELGMGAGWMITDYEKAGMPYDAVGVRISRLEESLAILKGLFADGSFSFSGTHYKITGFDGLPKPAQKPHPPILIGGGGKRILSIAAREADIVNVNFSLTSGQISPDSLASGSAERTAEKVKWVREAAGQRATQIEMSVTIFAGVVTDHPRQAAEQVGARFGMSAEQAMNSPHLLFGSVDGIVEELERRREEFGFSYVIFGGIGVETQSIMAPVVARLAGR
ncbi:MAG TPA: TIGR03621 family F420-dependent LLM class oxidoreductase [Blastocatellia bacterium]|nr:TIGR03621 family F420-dependent LLM class oxidoreductase [Blastocatellia bacterium]